MLSSQNEWENASVPFGRRGVHNSVLEEQMNGFPKFHIMNSLSASSPQQKFVRAINEQ